MKIENIYIYLYICNYKTNLLLSKPNKKLNKIKKKFRSEMITNKSNITREKIFFFANIILKKILLLFL